MEHSSQVEDILSDDEYEEGEILDEDILYEDVSSLEEFSESECCRRDDDRRSLDGKSWLVGSVVVENMRKKEHQCPKQSLCRKERSGKLCYTRLRKRQINGVRFDDEGSSSHLSNTAAKVDENDRRTNYRQTRKGVEGVGRSYFNRSTPGSRVNNRRRYDKRRGRNFPPITRPKRSFRDASSPASQRHRRFSSSADSVGTTTTSPPGGSPAAVIVGGCFNASNRSPGGGLASSSPIAATKSSLFDRLVGSGSIEPKTSSEILSVCSEVVTETETVCDKVMIDERDPKMAQEEGDEEELRLRLEALKTAVLRKHEGRKKKGAIFNRRNNLEFDDDPVNELALANSIDCDIGKPNGPHESMLLAEGCGAHELDPGQVSFHIPVLNSTNLAPRPSNVNKFRQKCLREIDANKNNIASKTAKVKKRRQRRKSLVVKRKGTLKQHIAESKDVAPEDNDEDILRQIALQSVKPRKTVVPGTLTAPNIPLLPSLHIETDSTGKLSTNPSSAETWEDLDEDILRAQLLSSLSSKMPHDDGSADTVVTTTEMARIPRGMINRNVSHVKRTLNKENARTFNKRNTNVNKVNVGRPVQPFIISLSQDSESSDNEDCPPEAEDICASIDLLLQDARQKTEQEQATKKDVEETARLADVYTKKGKDNTLGAKSQKPGKTTVTSTPVALRHLPVWQQEEYRQLKIKLAQKEKLREEARRKFSSKIVKTIPQLPVLNTDSVASPKAEPMQVSGEPALSHDDLKATPTLVEPQSISLEGQTDDDRTDSRPITASDSNALTSEPITVPPSSLPLFKTSSISKELREMSEMVVNFEKELNDYRLSKKEIGRLRKELALASNALTKKRRAILLSKERLKNKEITLATKIPPVNSPIPSAVVESTEQREVKLRAQVACISMSNDIKTPARAIKSSAKDPVASCLTPRKRLKLIPLKSTPEQPATTVAPAASIVNAKKVISVTESDALDPFTAICPFDLSGVCKDEECKFQHVKTS